MGFGAEIFVLVEKSCRIVFVCLYNVLAYFKPYSCFSISKGCNAFITLSLPIFITDIPLLPSISSLSAVDDEETGGPFTVHWLNNKELHFTLAMEVFLQQLRGSLEQQNECSQEGTEKYPEQALTLYLKGFFCM